MREFRTDRHNNPIAVAVKHNSQNTFTAALNSVKIKWSYGDKFPEGESNLCTIKFETKKEGQAGARVILSKTIALGGWYCNHTGIKVCEKYNIFNDKQFANASLLVQNAIINGIYEAEGGNGKLKLPMKIELLRNSKTGEFAFQKNEEGEKQVINKKNAINAFLTLFSRAVGCKDIDDVKWKQIEDTDEYF